MKDVTALYHALNSCTFQLYNGIHTHFYVSFNIEGIILPSTSDANGFLPLANKIAFVEVIKSDFRTWHGKGLGC